uniref:KxDL domain-containing protein n=1 Tax=Rhizophora mucronata TaxID=61149 RepID=A0A2P2IR49_RHIMU
MEEQMEKVSIREASQEVSRDFQTLINHDDLNSLKQLQHLTLGRLQDSNAVLSHFNEYSENCFAEVSPDFTRNTRLLKSMKSDLDYIFQKLRCVSVIIFRYAFAIIGAALLCWCLFWMVISLRKVML